MPVIAINSKRYYRPMINFRKRHIIEVSGDQKLNANVTQTINERGPDPIMNTLTNKKPGISNLGAPPSDNSMEGSGFRRKKTVTTKNDKLKKFVNLKI